LATGGEDNTIKVWSVQGTVAEFAGILEGHTASVTSLAFSPDGRRLVSGSRDGMAKVWDTRTLEQVLNLGRHTDSVTAVCFSSDGSRILSASIDKSAIVWLAEPISPTILPSDVVRTYPATVEQMGEPMLVDVQIQLLDPDTRNFGGGSLRVAFDAEPDSASGERLDIRRIAVDGHRTLFRSGDQVQYGITGSEDTIGAIQGDAGGLEITLTDQATVPAVQALLRSISYASDTALPGTRRITFRMIDEHGAPSNLAHCDILPAPASAPAGN
jgi:WD40 repeat protein